MNDIVAKKYVKAVLSTLSQSELEEFLENLDTISKAYKSDKFKSILSLPTLKTSKKVEFLLSLVKNHSNKFKNFMNLLAENKRFELMPIIASELKAQRAMSENVYLGKIYGNLDLDNKQIKALEDNFSKKFSATIKLETLKQEFNGIKVEIDDLGVEVSFSVDRLKAQMSEFILKAI